VSTLFENGNKYPIAKATCQYINRTWESYPFQSSMKKAVSEKIDTIQTEITKQYKRETGTNRITKKHRFILEKLFSKNEERKKLYKLHNSL